MGAENCNIERGDTVAIWGCGLVGQFAIRSAFMLGAERVIAIDHRSARLKLAADAGADTLNFEEVDVLYALLETTGGRGPDSCMNAVSMEAQGISADNMEDRAKQAIGIGTDRPHVLHHAISAVRKGGHISVPGVYGGFIDNFPMGAVVNKGLMIKSGQTHFYRYLKPLLARIENGEIDPRVVIAHRLKLDDAPMAYDQFKNNQDEFCKVVLKP